MARDTVRADLRTVCNLGVPEQPLILPVMDPFSAHLAGITYEEYSTKPEAMEKAWSNVIERFDIDWAGMCIDDLFEYEPLGIEVTNAPHLPFAVEKYLPATEETLQSLRLPDPTKEGRMPAHLEAEKRLRDRWGDSILIMGSTAAPFSGLTLLYGIEQTMLMLYDDPDFLRRSMRFIEELAVCWGRAVLEAGGDILWLGDCSASSRFLPVNLYRELCLEPAQRVASMLQEAGAKVIYHAGENKLPHLEAMAETGADILSVEAGPYMGEVKDAVGDRIALSGNLDSINLVWHGTDEAITATVNQLVSDVASRGGYIVNMGENTPEQTPPEHIDSLIRSIREAWKGIATT
ncbi:MAG: uroporphyrinogen decarboxylase family protein [Armatimonadetes bacterium]|nr:uroporphyrinogen decarboxylase family protein [Armatimonadota bacterium]